MRTVILLASIVCYISFCYGQTYTASCEIKNNSGVLPIYGSIILTQTQGGNLTMTLDISGFNGTAMSIGFHAHQISSLDNSCSAAGPHFNPFDVVHGGPSDTIRHVGDFGNVDVGTNGKISRVSITDPLATIIPNQKTNIIGKPLVIHTGTDDLGKGDSPVSNTTGNAGQRGGCCIIVQGQTGGTVSILSSLLLLLAMFALGHHCVELN